MDTKAILNAISIGTSLVIPEAGPIIGLVSQIFTALRNQGVPIPTDMLVMEHQMNQGVINLDVDTSSRIAAWRAAHPVTPAVTPAPPPT